MENIQPTSVLLPINSDDNQGDTDYEIRPSYRQIVERSIDFIWLNVSDNEDQHAQQYRSTIPTWVTVYGNGVSTVNDHCFRMLVDELAAYTQDLIAFYDDLRTKRGMQCDENKILSPRLDFGHTSIPSHNPEQFLGVLVELSNLFSATVG